MRLSPALFVAALAMPAVAAGETGAFTNIDVFELEVAADPQISPDGKEVAYVRQSMDIMTDQPRSGIWIVGTDTGEHRALLAGNDDASSPRWSPDGSRIAYVTAVEGRGAQVHVRWMDTGQTAMLTNLRESPQALAWSPDGTQLAFSMRVPGEGPGLATPPAQPEGAEWAAPVRVIDRLLYRVDGRGYLEAGNTHIFVVPAVGGTPHQLTSGDFNHNGPLSWSPDGTTIAFSADRTDDYEYPPNESEIWTVTVADGTLAQLTDRAGPDGSPAYSPDGSTIVYRGYDDRRMGYHNTGVYVMDADGGNKRELTAGFDRSIDAVEWAGSSTRLYVQYDDHGEGHLATLSLRGEIESQASDLGSVALGRPYSGGQFSVASNGAYAYTAGTVYRPADVGYASRGGRPRKLTSLNEDLLARRTLGQVEKLTWTSADGLEIEGWLVTPPDFDPRKKYPLLLEIHGGPFAAYGPHFSAEVQLYAAAGYVVLYPNPRGSTSYGDDFANRIHHDYPGQDYDDLMAGVDAAIARGFVDADQLYVTGGSGGGTLTAWIVGKTDRFRAAAAVKPVINWASFVLTADGVAFAEYWFGSMPWEDPQAFWRRSPLSLVGNVSTPTMVMTGEQDLRTPIPEAEQYYRALKFRRIDTALVRIPDASHGIAGRPSQLIAKVDNILGWFAKYRD